jgi:hypothetical protein
LDWTVRFQLFGEAGWAVVAERDELSALLEYDGKTALHYIKVGPKGLEESVVRQTQTWRGHATRVSRLRAHVSGSVDWSWAHNTRAVNRVQYWEIRPLKKGRWSGADATRSGITRWAQFGRSIHGQHFDRTGNPKGSSTWTPNAEGGMSGSFSDRNGTGTGSASFSRRPGGGFEGSMNVNDGSAGINFAGQYAGPSGTAKYGSHTASGHRTNNTATWETNHKSGDTTERIVSDWKDDNGKSQHTDTTTTYYHLGGTSSFGVATTDGKVTTVIFGSSGESGNSLTTVRVHQDGSRSITETFTGNDGGQYIKTTEVDTKGKVTAQKEDTIPAPKPSPHAENDPPPVPDDAEPDQPPPPPDDGTGMPDDTGSEDAPRTPWGTLGARNPSIREMIELCREGHEGDEEASASQRVREWLEELNGTIVAGSSGGVGWGDAAGSESYEPKALGTITLEGKYHDEEWGDLNPRALGALMLRLGGSAPPNLISSF